MLRPLYICVLRLHPHGFRRRFADEMLSIFDQAAGNAAAFTLLVDGFLSLTRQWALRPQFWHELSPPPQPASDGIPSFQSLDPFRPRAGAVIHGVVLSTAVFCLTCFAIRYSWIHVLHVRIPEVQSDKVQFESPRSNETNSGADARGGLQRPIAQQRAPSNAMPDAPSPPHSSVNMQAVARTSPSAVPNHSAQKPGIESSDQSSQAGASKSQVDFAPQPATEGGAQPKHRRATGPGKPADLQAYSPLFVARSGLPQPQSLQPRARDATGTQNPTKAKADEGTENVTLDAAQRRRVIQGAVANLTRYYIDPDVAQKMADALLAHEKNGEDDAATDGERFADLLTKQMQDVSHDQYVVMVYSAVSPPENPPAPTPEEVVRYRKEMDQTNCTIETTKILPHNIGYMKFNAFPDTSVCRTRLTAAMSSLNTADAVIFDLRDNRGGYSDSVALIATYLFDRPTHLNDFYERGENSTEQSWTLPPVPGNRLADKPVYVLTSHTTFSAAEGFSYDLKMLKRATLVGETTSGRGHTGMRHRIDDQFTIRIPGMKVINPISKTNWEGTGVEPDVKVEAADALQTALKLAEDKRQK
jgi:hypothetical protein